MWISRLPQGAVELTSPKPVDIPIGSNCEIVLSGYRGSAAFRAKITENSGNRILAQLPPMLRMAPSLDDYCYRLPSVQAVVRTEFQATDAWITYVGHERLTLTCLGALSIGDKVELEVHVQPESVSRLDATVLSSDSEDGIQYTHDLALATLSRIDYARWMQLFDWASTEELDESTMTGHSSKRYIS
jgi:hypothetical protein